MPMSFPAGPAGGETVIVTASGTVAVLPGQETLVWQPAAPVGPVDFLLPAAPGLNETHVFKAQLATPGPTMQVTPAAGHTIEGKPYWVGVQPDDGISLKWVGGGLWIIMP